MTSIRAGSATDVGMVRTNNEDLALVGDSLWAVADGMGGHAGGEVASRTAIDTLLGAFSNDPTTAGLEEAVRRANEVVWQKGISSTELRGMGTTITALGVVRADGGDRLALVNVGDSRAYLLHDGELSQLTEDHSLVEEWVRSGELSPEEATLHPQRHIVTRALGAGPEVDVDTILLAPALGDRVMLCSDGLTDEVGDSEIAEILAVLKDPQAAAADLVQAARDHGGNDNITVVVIDVQADGPAADGPGEVARARSQEPDHTAVGLIPAQGSAEAEQRATGDDEPPVAGRAGRRQGRIRRPGRRITLRVVVFCILMLAVIGGAVAAVGWFATRSYYVSLSGNHLAIYQGRPGGFLWFQPRLAVLTGVTTSNVLPSRLSDLRHGTEESSLDAAKHYVSNLKAEARSLPAAGTASAASTAPGAAPAAP